MLMNRDSRTVPSALCVETIPDAPGGNADGARNGDGMTMTTYTQVRSHTRTLMEKFDGRGVERTSTSSCTRL